MSLSSKVILGVACAASVGTILFVHYKEWLDKKKLHEGVIRDTEKQKKKTENLFFLQQQIEMNKILKKQQTHDEEIALKLLQDSQRSEG